MSMHVITNSMFVFIYIHSSQKLSPQQGIITASLMSSLQILQVSSGGTEVSIWSTDFIFISPVAILETKGHIQD